MSEFTIVRYGMPTKMDEAPYGSKCIVKRHQDDIYHMYLQVSHKDDNPNWELIGVFGPQSPEEYIQQLIKRRLDI